MRCMRAFLLATLALAEPALAERPEEYVPAPAKDISGYWETPLPCKLVRGERNSMGRVEETSDDDTSANVATYVVL